MFEVFLLAFALSMDAFAVSIGLGIKVQNFNKIFALKVSLFFGLFQGLMPLIGYLASMGLGSFISSFAHWIAFILLTLIGAKMLYESFNEGVEEEISLVTTKVLLILAIATSIDAMAAGFTLNLLDMNPFLSMLVISIVTFLFSYLGVFMGTVGGEYLEDIAEKIGGTILILIGVKILLEHLFFQ